MIVTILNKNASGIAPGNASTVTRERCWEASFLEFVEDLAAMAGVFECEYTM
jgi:hypothetical protein